MKTVSQEQAEAIAELSPVMIERSRKFEKLQDSAVGLDGITKCDCYYNGRDTASELGITTANGFSDAEIERANYYFTLETAKFYEII